MAATKEELLVYIQNLRLQQDKIINDDKINKNAHVKEEKTTFKGFLKNTGHALVRAVTDYEEKAKLIDKNIYRFNETHPTVISESEAKEAIESLFINDDLDLISLLFACSVIFDNEYKYQYPNETLRAASELLYNRPEALLDTKKGIEDIYCRIYDTSLNENQMAAMGMVVFSVLVGVIGLVSGSAPLLSTSSAALVGGAVIGSVYGGMKIYNYGKGACDIKNLTPSETALNLSIQLLFIMNLHDKLTRDTFKEKLDEILKANANLKADVDYYLFVEQVDPSNNEAKLKQFHRFEELLSRYLSKGSLDY